MKKIILSLVLLFCANVAVLAQQKSSNSTFLEFQSDFNLQKGVDPDISLKYGFLKNVENNIKLGAGVGIRENTSFDFAPSMPIFGRAEFMLSNNETVNPYIDFDLGYIVNFEEFSQGAVFINPMLGLSVKKVNLGVGYFGGTSFAKGAQWGSAIAVRLGYNFNGNGKKFVWKNSGLYKFFKHTTFGIEGSAAVGLSSATGKDEYRSGEAKGKSLSARHIGIHWLYDIDQHWSAGLGAQFGTISYELEDRHNDSEEHKDNNIDLFLRCEYTHDEIVKNLKPYADFDLGWSSVGRPGYVIGPQIGVKYKDHYRLGVSALYRGRAYFDGPYTDAENYAKSATTLQLNLGIDF